MGVKERLETAEIEQTADAPTDSRRSESPDGDISPFSMNYDLESYEVDSETADQMLSLLVAATNLL